MRKKIVAGNWKMNLTFKEAEELFWEVTDGLEDKHVKKGAVVLCPPFPYLEMAMDIAHESKFLVGAQNMSDKESGAFTGEVSAPMLKSIGVTHCIIGHSERRKYFGESGALLAGKVRTSLNHQIIPIFCCGEVLAEREAGKHQQVVREQLEESLFGLTPKDFDKVVIAYEPVWAIGTGVNATPDQAEEMHAFLRNCIEAKYGKDAAGKAVLLYGGSCNARNAPELFAMPDVDGGLIGGASLKGEEFLQIVEAMLKNQ